MILFVIADVVSLVIQVSEFSCCPLQPNLISHQAVGGGRAAVQSQNYEDTTTSTNISKSPHLSASLL